jgi:HTH-type transcriptional regulator/antitoxin HigA
MWYIYAGPRKFGGGLSNLANKDLVEIIGSKSKVSEVLNKKRRLTLEMIRKLSKNLHIPTELLINEYELTEH